MEGNERTRSLILEAEKLLVRMKQLEPLKRWEEICGCAREACEKILLSYLLAVGSSVGEHRFLTTLGCCARASELDFDSFLFDLEKLDTYFWLQEDFPECYRRGRRNLKLARRVAKSAMSLTENLLTFAREKLRGNL